MTFVQLLLHFFVVAAIVSLVLSSGMMFDEAIRQTAYARYQGLDGLVRNSILGGVFAFPFVIFLGFIVGLPTDWLINRFSLTTAWTIGIAGAVMGFGVGLVMAGWTETLPFSLAGLIAGLLWWMLVRRKNINGYSNA